ncbi:hypothetical protein [Pontibacter ramchanderi]|uniref:Uncharacterized protein n=1 Tax=Pontibacter ramchanderi TaxID=1179743 RepID=A0A2N3V2U4_9BACT|nr:hypothetical protein [Pontibacter ramchanderi]PKV75955.1 hypothetical protein BD749_0903 [Pontibacter ramchanderi]
MTHKRLLLLNELQELAMGLPMGNKLLLKPVGSILTCQFVMGGLVSYLVEVRNELLMDTLLQKGVEGIIEGEHYSAFIYGFEGMALRVKAQLLFKELDLEQTELSSAYLQAFVA